MTAKRFTIDDAGTLIDMQTRDTFDYVSDMCPLLNELHEENKELKQELLEVIDASSDNRPNKKGFAGNGRFA